MNDVLASYCQSDAEMTRQLIGSFEGIQKRMNRECYEQVVKALEQPEDIVKIGKHGMVVINKAARTFNMTYGFMEQRVAYSNACKRLGYRPDTKLRG